MLLVYRVGHRGVGLLPELNLGGSSSDAVGASKACSDTEMRDHDSSSSVDSKEGSIDVKHFIEV